MPSTQPQPTIAQLTDAARKGLQGEQDIYGDARSGSLHNHAAGPLAIIFSRESDADRDNFRAIYFDDADDSDLTSLVQGRTGIARTMSTPGPGTCSFTRSSAAAGGGMFWGGTRIQVSSGQGSTAQTRVYTFAADTTIPASSKQITINIQASAAGTGFAVQNARVLQLLDQVYDPLWLPTTLSCVDGTNFEPADQYRGRARATFANNRNGYLPKLLTAVKGQGAAYLVTFAGNFGLPATRFFDSDYLVGISTVTTTQGGAATLITTTAPHGLLTGAYATLANISIGVGGNPLINAVWLVTVQSPTSFSIPLAFVGAYSPGTGIVTAGGQADYGLCAAYVADANYSSPKLLIQLCGVAIDGARGLGADMWVGGIQTVQVSLGLLVTMRDDPGKFDLVAIARAITQSLLASFSPTQGGYNFKLTNIAGAATATAGQGVQTIQAPYVWQPATQYAVGSLVVAQAVGSNPLVDTTFQCVAGGISGSTQPVFAPVGTVTDGGVTWLTLTTPGLGVFFGGVQQTADPVLVAGQLPATLSRYTLLPQNVSLTFMGPV